jgi:hypothetical protein
MYYYMFQCSKSTTLNTFLSTWCNNVIIVGEMFSKSTELPYSYINYTSHIQKVFDTSDIFSAHLILILNKWLLDIIIYVIIIKNNELLL